jgi:subtilisin family serine protease
MIAENLIQPWTARRKGACLPGSFLVKMTLGEAPEHVATVLDVRRKRQSPSVSLDGGPVDRVVRSASRLVRYSRVHCAAASFGIHGESHRRFDDAEHVFGLARTFRVDVDPGAPIADLVQSLLQLGTVEAASPNYLCAVPFAHGAALPAFADDDSSRLVRNLIHASEALGYETGDPRVLVAVVDSGVTLDHPELANCLRPGFDTVQLGDDDLAFGIELLGDRTRPDTNPTDGFVGHGNACAAIIGAIGKAMPPGLAGDASVLPLRALAAARMTGVSAPVGIGAISDLDAAVKVAVDLGAKILSLSFGTEDAALDPSDPKPHADVVRYALERGCILVAASGNTGDDTVYWPAAHPGVIAVGACDVTGAPTAFSTRGPHVALCAPGQGVLTAAVTGYQLATGTSFAAPFVAATAALLVSRAERRSFPIDGSMVRALLMRSATAFRAKAAGCGEGVLNASAALRALDDAIDRSRPSGGDDDN